MNTTRTAVAYSSRWDLFGTCGSTLCVAHCLLTPLLIALVPIAGLEILESESIHKGFVLFVAAVGILAFGPGYLTHRKNRVLFFMSLGLASLFFAAFGVEPIFGHESAEVPETIFTILGGVLMVSAHWMNRTFCRLCRECDATGGC